MMQQNNYIIEVYLTERDGHHLVYSDKMVTILYYIYVL